MENIQTQTYNFANEMLNNFSINTTPLHFYIRVFSYFTELSDYTVEESQIANNIYLRYILNVQDNAINN